MMVSWTLFFIWLTLLSKANALEVAKREPKPHRVTPCACRYKGVLYDISNLARRDGQARFTIDGFKTGDYFSYNPCIPFTQSTNISGLPYHCNNVAICSWSANGQRRDPLGYQNPWQIHCEITIENNIALVYKQGGQGKLQNYNTTIEMICDQKETRYEDARLELKSKTSTAMPVFQLFHQCCCIEGCSMCHPPDMIYYEIGIPVGGFLVILTAGFVGFLIAKKKYRHDEEVDRLLPEAPGGDRNGYDAVAQQDGDGGGGGADAGADTGTDADSYATESDLDISDNDVARYNYQVGVGRSPSEHDESA